MGIISSASLGEHLELPPAVPHMSQDLLSLACKRSWHSSSFRAYYKAFSAVLRASTVTASPTGGTGGRCQCEAIRPGSCKPGHVCVCSQEAGADKLLSVVFPGASLLGVFLPRGSVLGSREPHSRNLHFLFCRSHHRSH